MPWPRFISTLPSLPGYNYKPVPNNADRSTSTSSATSSSSASTSNEASPQLPITPLQAGRSGSNMPRPYVKLWESSPSYDPENDHHDYSHSPTSSAAARLSHQIRRRPLRVMVMCVGLTLVVFVIVSNSFGTTTVDILKKPFNGDNHYVPSWWTNSDDDEYDEISDQDSFNKIGSEDVESGDEEEEESDSFLSVVPVETSGSDIERTQSFKEDPNHILIPQTSLDKSPYLLRPPPDRLPENILSSFYTRGAIDTSKPIPQPPSLDVVYLWVNASDPFFQASMEDRAAQEGVGGRGRGKRYRDNGELRGALRSAVSSFGDRLGTVHVLSGDYSFNSSDPDLQIQDADAEKFMASDDGAQWTMGQIPKWLDWESAKNGLSKIRWHFHSSVFRMPADQPEITKQEAVLVERTEEQAWREETLPSFNSFAIESRVGWMNGLAENYLLANDDMFFLNELSQADFAHPLYGSVFRMDPGPGLRVKPVVTPDVKSSPGEWGGLQHAALLIKERFTNKKRMYMAHMPKALTLSVTHEASVMFGAQLSEAATRGFRQSKRGVADVEMSWLVSHLKIERWREALLWTWAVAKMGGVEGLWGEDARSELGELLGVDTIDEDSVLVERGYRATLRDLEKINQQAKWEGAQYTKYYFSSMDGVLPERPDRPRSYSQCTFTFSRCLPADFFDHDEGYSAVDMFKHLTFVEPECGDCLVSALVTASGYRGLEAFFPAPELNFQPPHITSSPHAPITNNASIPVPMTVFDETPLEDSEIASDRTETQWTRSEPMLPLTPTWESANFSLANVVRSGQDKWTPTSADGNKPVNLRQWCIKLLSRYSYVMGETPTQFSQIYTTNQLNVAFQKLARSPRVSMICINDDQPDAGSVGAIEVFGQWMKGRWGAMNAGWERPGVKWAGDRVDE